MITRDPSRSREKTVETGVPLMARQLYPLFLSVFVAGLSCPRACCLSGVVVIMMTGTCRACLLPESSAPSTVAPPHVRIITWPSVVRRGGGLDRVPSKPCLSGQVAGAVLAPGRKPRFRMSGRAR